MAGKTMTTPTTTTSTMTPAAEMGTAHAAGEQGHHHGPTTHALPLLDSPHLNGLLGFVMLSNMTHGPGAVVGAKQATVSVQSVDLDTEKETAAIEADGGRNQMGERTPIGSRKNSDK